jgi:hypothetical protein
MPVPDYDYYRLAWVVHATGEVKALIVVGREGSPASLDVRGPFRILTGSVESSLKGSRFSRDCAGQTIEIKFVYRQEGKPSAEPHSRISLKGPNTFEIVARPPIPIPTQPSSTSPEGKQ